MTGWRARLGTLGGVLALLWLGMLVGVSFIATPVKFAAASLTLPVALDVGRTTFHAFVLCELGVAALLVAATLLRQPRTLAPILLALGAGLVVIAQIVWLLPLLDARVEQVIAAEPMPASSLHTIYIAAELVKLGFLAALSWLLLRRQAAPGSVETPLASALPDASLADPPHAWSRRLFEGTPDGVIVTDAEGRIQHWGQGSTRIFGFTAEEAIGRSLDLIVPEAQRARHWQGFDRVMQTGISRYADGDVMAVPALTRSGDRISIEFTLLLLHDPAGNVAGTVATIRDVTQRFNELRDLRRQLAEQASTRVGVHN